MRMVMPPQTRVLTFQWVQYSYTTPSRGTNSSDKDTTFPGRCLLLYLSCFLALRCWMVDRRCGNASWYGCTSRSQQVKQYFQRSNIDKTGLWSSKNLRVGNVYCVTPYGFFCFSRLLLVFAVIFLFPLFLPYPIFVSPFSPFRVTLSVFCPLIFFVFCVCVFLFLFLLFHRFVPFFFTFHSFELFIVVFFLHVLWFFIYALICNSLIYQ